MGPPTRRAAAQRKPHKRLSRCLHVQILPGKLAITVSGLDRFIFQENEKSTFDA
jgi:hypothetical protein